MLAHDLFCCRAAFAAACAVLTLASASKADVIVTASGANTFNTPEFFTVAAPDIPAGVSLIGVLIDLQGGTDPDDFWDANQAGGNSPWGFKTGSGVSAGDVLFDPANGSPLTPSVLDISITPGAMTSGDFFTFDFDTDITISNGDDFGSYGVTVDFVFSNGITVNSVFLNDGSADLTSSAVAPNVVIPESRTVWLLLLASGGLVSLAIRKQQVSRGKSPTLAL